METVITREIILSKAAELQRVTNELQGRLQGSPAFLPVELFPFALPSNCLLPRSASIAKLPHSVVSILFGTVAGKVSSRRKADGGIDSGHQPGYQPLRMSYLEPFRPKADADYLARIAPRLEQRSRSHETLVNAFACWVQDKGLPIQCNQAIDLAVGDPPVIVEAKVLPEVGYQDLVRQAIGQLYEYCYFCIARPTSKLVFFEFACAFRRMDGLPGKGPADRHCVADR